MPQEESLQPSETHTKSFGANALDSLRQAGCKVVNQHLPNYIEDVDAAEIFGVTAEQFKRAFDLEWIRLGRPENSVVAALYHENERLRGELNRVGLFIDHAVHGNKSSDEPYSITGRLDMVRLLASRANMVYAEINEPIFNLHRLREKFVKNKE